MRSAVGLLVLMICLARGWAQETPLSEQARELLQSPDIAVAALRAERMRQQGGAARAELMLVLREPGLADHVLQGVLTALVERNDRAEKTIDQLVALYAKSEGRVRERLREALLRYDAKGSVLTAPLAGLTVKGAALGAILDLTVLLADSPEEKRDATAALIARLQQEEDRDTAGMLHASLTELTFHRYARPADWAQWCERFRGAHPDGFTVRELALDAVQEAGRVERERRLTEARRAIQLLAAAKVLPAEYLDAARTPDAEIRQAAAALMAEAAAGDAQRCDEALARLKQALAAETDPSVRMEVVKSLGDLAQSEPRLAEAASKVLLPLLNAEDPLLLRRAVVSLRQCQQDLAPVLGPLYLRLLQQGSATAEARREVVAALAGRSSGAHLLIDALKDKDEQVRRTAALGLALASGDLKAQDLAAPLDQESDPQVASSLLKCLGQLGQWEDPAVAKSVLRLLSGDVRLRIEAAATLLGALCVEGEHALPQEMQHSVLAALEPFWKIGLSDLAARKTLTERLGQTPLSPAVTGTVLGWALSENDSATALALTAVLAAIRAPDAEVFLTAADRMSEAGRPAAAELLLQALLTPGAAEHCTEAQRGIARRKLIDSFMAHAEETDLRQLEALLDAQAKQEPASRELARNRAVLRYLQRRWKDTLAELATGLSGEESSLTPAQLERYSGLGARAALELGDGPQALAHIERLGALAARTELRFLKARALLLKGQPSACLQELAAITPQTDGTPGESEYLRLRVEAALLQSSSPLRLRAAEDYARLMEIHGGKAIASLDARIQADAAARLAVSTLDAATTPAEALEQVGALERLGAQVSAPWLLSQLDRFAQNTADGQRGLGHRVLALQRLFPNRDGLRQLTPPQSEAEARAVLEGLEKFAAALESPSAG